MRLVEHVGRIEAVDLTRLRVDQLIEDQEDPERIDGAGVEVVVAVLRVIEVEPAELAELDQPRDDLLDGRIYFGSGSHMYSWGAPVP